MDSDEETLEETVEGHLDDDGLPHGFCTVTYSSTDRFEGNFVHGEKNGRGKFFFFDGSTLEGYYVDDALQGQGIYTYEDGVVLHGTYVDGELNGPAQEYDSDGRLIFKGQYKDNIRHGVCWIYYPLTKCCCAFWKCGYLEVVYHLASLKDARCFKKTFAVEAIVNAWFSA
uniref:Histone-lysine N-methyltransferase SETD7 n=1 Tax=Aquila chrysaetos chrysaetos TaxID=223781 RepID=A0A663E452_AQUCH